MEIISQFWTDSKAGWNYLKSLFPHDINILFWSVCVWKKVIDLNKIKGNFKLYDIASKIFHFKYTCCSRQILFQHNLFSSIAFSYTFTVDENQTVSRNSALAAAAKNRTTTG